MSNSGYFKLKQVLQQSSNGFSKKKITVNVRSATLTGINLPYVRGNYSRDGISVRQAITMNAIISSLQSQQRKDFQSYMQSIIDSEQGESEKKISILKSITELSASNYTQKVLSRESATGIVINTVQ